PEAGDLIAVIGLLDLHGLPLKFPRARDPANARCDWAKQELERRVDRPEFHQFFAVHELEAWLLSQPALFGGLAAKAVAKIAREPERVNDKTPPAKFLNTAYEKETGRGYKKTTNGVALFAKLDPAIAAEKCPHLKAMLETMLDLAKAKGL
ncbi:MAG: DUF4276 family protein, partial [Candidatus Methylomirabilis sp.]|nr:DUF4276 family protein [Deltaproteobacteria bacterium]